MTDAFVHKITIENFVVIDKAEIDIKDINVIIGPQANGKSLIAKLIYYFKSLNEVFVDFARNEFFKENLDANVIVKFNEYFPSYLWEKSSFNIKYVCGNVSIDISHKKNKARKSSFFFEIQYCERLIELIRRESNKIQEKYGKKILDSKSSVLDRYEGNYRASVMLRSVRKELVSFNKFYFGEALFVPAGRSFFAILQRNIFTMLSQNINVDPLIRDFGAFYENIKRVFDIDGEFPLDESELDPACQQAFASIAKGRYIYQEEKDWILSPTGLKTNLADTSSGQQESIPLLLALTVYPQIRNMLKVEHMIFIEEPEAHLFPSAQADVMSLLSSIHDDLKTSFFITTHSPYVIAALNNMIQANEVLKKGGLSKKEFEEINGGGAPLAYDSVSAYTIENGVSRSIMEEEYKMIGGYTLDAVSSHFQDVMNKILERDD